MLIAQITDIHIGAEPGNPAEPNLHRLKLVLHRLIDGPNRPDLLLLTGDLTEFGDAESYARLAEAVSICPFPVRPLVGNHDRRETLLAAFPLTPTDGGFIHYELEAGGARLLLLDTLEPGRHGGGFCRDRADWLAVRLRSRPDSPTIIAMHHPPFETGIAWLDGSTGESWMQRFAATIAGHGQVKAIISGHLHRTIQSNWNGASLTVCPSTAPAVALDLDPVDPDRPDGREMILDEPPGYALHRWNDGHLVSHFGYVGDWRVLAHYDQALQRVVRIIDAERNER